MDIESAIIYWPLLQKLEPKFRSKIDSFYVIGNNGTDFLIQTNDCKFYGFGTNVYGLLGVGHSNEIYEPLQINHLCGKQLTDICTGASHLVALTKSGQLLNWGQNCHNQLAIQQRAQTSELVLHWSLIPKSIHVTGHQFIAVRCGRFHSIALSSNGQIVTWGNNRYGQVCFKDSAARSQPIVFQELRQHRIVQIAAGDYHSVVLSDRGKVLAWGANHCGQLGVGQHRQRNRFYEVVVAGESFKAICASGTHTMFLTEMGLIYSTGNNLFGQLGYRTEERYSFEPKMIHCENRFCQIGSHGNLSVALSEDGFCFVWGQLANLLRDECTPRQTWFRTIDDVIAAYSTDRSTPHLVPIIQHSTIDPDVDVEDLTVHDVNHNIVIDPNSQRRASNPVLDRFATLFNSPESSDVRFVFDPNNNQQANYKEDDEVLYAHRWFLQNSCQYFRRFFTTINDENVVQEIADEEDQKNLLQHKTIVITDYSYSVYQCYLRYLYAGKFIVPKTYDIEMLDLCVRYENYDLLERCLERLYQTLSIDNCCSLYRIAIEFNLIQFESKVVSFITQNLMYVLKSQEFESIEPPLCKSLMLSIGTILFDTNFYKLNLQLSL